MGWFWDKQPPSVRLCSCAHKHNHSRVLHQGGDERKRMKAALSYLADDEKNDNTHRRAYGLYVCTRANTHTHTHSQQICLKSDRSFTLPLHSSLLSFYCFSSARHTDKHAHAQARTHARCSHTQLTKAQKSFQRTAELLNLWCFNKTNCLFSCDEAPTTGANKYKHGCVGNKD